MFPSVLTAASSYNFNLYLFTLLSELNEKYILLEVLTLKLLSLATLNVNLPFLASSQKSTLLICPDFSSKSK